MNVYVCIALIAFGIAFHFVLKLGELEKRGQIIRPIEYWKKNPYTSLTVVMAAYLYLAWRWSEGPMTIGDAIMVGIACNSIGDKLRAEAETAVK